MDSPIPRGEITALASEAETAEEFLEQLDGRAREHIQLVHAHPRSDNHGRVTIIGGVHGGEETRKTVQRVIATERPQHIAVELDPIQYHLAKILKSEQSTLEQVAAIFEADKRDIESHPIDRHRWIIRIREAVSGGGIVRLSAIAAIGKLIASFILFSIMLFTLFIGELLVASFPALLLGIILVQFVKGCRTDPDRKYDYALISIIRNQYPESVQGAGIVEDVVETRDRKMASRLDSLRKQGDVVAVVGYNHISGIKRNMDAKASEWETTNISGKDGATAPNGRKSI